MDWANLIDLANDSVVKDWILQVVYDPALSPLFLTFNLLVSFAALGLMGYHLMLGILVANETGKHEKVTRWFKLGGFRSVLAMGLLIPTSSTGINGAMTLVGYLCLFSAHIVQSGWDEAKTAFYTDASLTAALMPDHRNITDAIFTMQACKYYASLANGKRNGFEEGYWTTQTARKYNLEGWLQWNNSDPSNISIHPVCGRLKLQYPEDLGKLDSFDFRDDIRSFMQQHQSAIERLTKQISRMSLGFAAANFPETRKENQNPDIAAIKQVMENYNASRREALKNLNANIYSKLSNSQQSKDAKDWVYAGSYYRHLADAGHLINKASQYTNPSIEKPQFNTIWPNPPLYVSRFLKELQALRIGYTDGDISTLPGSLALSIDEQKNEQGSTGIESQIVKAITSAIRDSIQQFYIDPNKSDHPISQLVSSGQIMYGVGGTIFLSTAAMGAVPIAGDGVIAKAATIAKKVEGPLLDGGEMLVLWIPMIPYFAFSAGIIAWFLVIIWALISTPVYLVFQVAPQTDAGVFMGDGWRTLVELIIRPILLIIGLGIAYALYPVLVDFVHLTYGFAIDANTTNIAGSIFEIFLLPKRAYWYAVIQTGLAAAVFILIVPALPTMVMKVIPGNIEGGQ